MITAFWWLYFQNGTTISTRVLGAGSLVLVRDVLGIAHYLVVLGLIGIAAGLGGAIELADSATLPASVVISLCGGVVIYEIAQVLIGRRYGLSGRVAGLWATLTVALGAVVIILGTSWPPWLTVAVLLAGTGVHFIVGPYLARRVTSGLSPRGPAL